MIFIMKYVKLKVYANSFTNKLYCYDRMEIFFWQSQIGKFKRVGLIEVWVYNQGMKKYLETEKFSRNKFVL